VAIHEVAAFRDHLATGFHQTEFFSFLIFHDLQLIKIFLKVYVHLTFAATK